MSFFHCTTAFTSSGSIPASDSVSRKLKWCFEKLQVYEDLQQLQVSLSLFCLNQNSIKMISRGRRVKAPATK